MDLKNVLCGKNVLVTGHTGFKGAWLCLWLGLLGANVTGYSLEDMHPQGVFMRTGLQQRMTHLAGDIRDLPSLKKAFAIAQPDAVMHLAAQPIVRRGHAKPIYTYEVNVMGTLHVLECIRQCDKCQAGIIITSDKCYQNEEWVYGYRETDRIGGSDIYASSKSCAELLVKSYRASYTEFGCNSKLLCTARAGNVIGGGDFGEHRIVPDCINALERGESILLRSPNAVRPWQHVLEPLQGYLLLLAHALDGNKDVSGAWNFGPGTADSITVEALVQKLIAIWGHGGYKIEIDNSVPESALLYLDAAKARHLLEWIPVWNIDTALSHTAAWYRSTADAYALCVHQIDQYGADKERLNRSEACASAPAGPAQN